MSSSSTESSLYHTCMAQHNGDLEYVLPCISNYFEEQAETTSILYVDESDNDELLQLQSWLLVLMGGMVFFMQAGFALICAGSVRRKNVKNTMLKNLLDACGSAIAFTLLGYSLAMGGSNSVSSSSFMGNADFSQLRQGGRREVDMGMFFFQFAFSATATTIVAGTLAERCQMIAYLCFSLILSGFVYPIVAHNIWNSNGYLSLSNANSILGGALDFAGSGVVHLTGGCTSLYATLILGPRRGRFDDEQNDHHHIKGHSLALQMCGTLILWFGWYGFNPGSALLLDLPPGSKGTGAIGAHAAVTTTLAAAGGAIGGLFANGYRLWRRYNDDSGGGGEFTLDLAAGTNGLLSGLVAVTAGCAVVELWAALLIGVIAGILYVASSRLLIRFHIDDAVDAIPVHLFNGLWGLLAVGLLASPSLLDDTYGDGSSHQPGWFYQPTDSNLLPAQIVGALFIILWTMGTMLPLFFLLSYLGWFRVDKLDELIGLDAGYYGDHDPSKLFDESNSSDDREARLAAYKKRFEQRHQKRTVVSGGTRQSHKERHSKKKSIDDMLDESWGGGIDLSSVAGGA